MIIGGGIDIPYVGFEIPLAILTFPLAFLFVLMFGYKYAKKISYEEIAPKLNNEPREKFGFRVYIPIFAAIILMVVNKAVPQIPDLGMPLVFLISAVIGLFTGYKIDILKTCKEAINSVLPVLGRYLLHQPAQSAALCGDGNFDPAVRRGFVLRRGFGSGCPVPDGIPR